MCVRMLEPSHLQILSERYDFVHINYCDSKSASDASTPSISLAQIPVHNSYRKLSIYGTHVYTNFK